MYCCQLGHKVSSHTKDKGGVQFPHYRDRERAFLDLTAAIFEDIACVIETIWIVFVPQHSQALYINLRFWQAGVIYLSYDIQDKPVKFPFLLNPPPSIWRGMSFYLVSSYPLYFLACLQTSTSEIKVSGIVSPSVILIYTHAFVIVFPSLSHFSDIQSAFPGIIFQINYLNTFFQSQLIWKTPQEQTFFQEAGPQDGFL